MTRSLRVLLCVLLCFILIQSSIPSSVGICAEVDGGGSAKVVAEFDRTAYLPGETATMTISLMGFEDEAAQGRKFATFETHIGFDNTKLSFNKKNPEDTEEQAEISAFDAKLQAELAAGTSEQALQVTEDYEDVVLVFFEMKDGIDFNTLNVQNGKLKIAELKFTVNGAAGEKITAGFEEKQISGSRDYVTVFMLSEPGKLSEIPIQVGTTEWLTADVIQAVMRDDSAAYDAGSRQVSAKITVGASKEALLVVALYDEESGLLKSDVMTKPISVGAPAQQEITFSYSGATANLKVRYFLWDSIGVMKPLAPKVLTPVAAD